MFSKRNEENPKKNHFKVLPCHTVHRATANYYSLSTSMQPCSRTKKNEKRKNFTSSSFPIKKNNVIKKNCCLDANKF